MRTLTLASIFWFWLPGSLFAAQPTVGDLIKALNNSRQNRLMVMRQLGDRGKAAKEAVPILVRYLSLKDTTQADQAARSLAQIGPACTPELLKVLSGASAEAQKRALFVLGVLGPEAGAEAASVAAFLRNKDVKLRTLAAQVLAEMGTLARPATTRLAEALRDPDNKVRTFAAEALREIGIENVSHLVALMEDEDLSLRLSMLQCLALFHESDTAVHVLVKALRDPEARIRKAAAATLLRLGPEAAAALPDLRQALEEHDQDVQIQAFTAIMSVAECDAKLLQDLNALSASTRWSEKRKHANGAPDRKSSFPRLVEGLEDPNPTRRLAAALRIGTFSLLAKGSLSALKKNLDDPNGCVKTAVLIAICRVEKRLDARKVSEMIETIFSDMKSDNDPEIEAVIQFHMLVTLLSGPEWTALARDKLKNSLEEAVSWTTKALEECGHTVWAIPALTRGINACAEFDLGFAAPFGALSLKLKSFVEKSKDVQQLIYAFTHLGQNVPKHSRYFPSIEQNRLQVFSNDAFIDNMIAMKQRKQGQAFLGLNGARLHDLWLGALRPCGLHHSRTFTRMQSRTEQALVREQVDIQALFLVKAQRLWPKLSKKSHQDLIALLHDPDPFLRWVVINLIGRKRIHAERELINALRDPVPDVRMAVREALYRLSRGTDFGPGLLDTPAAVDRTIQRWQNWLALQGPGSASPSSTYGTHAPAESARSLPRQKKE